MLDATSTPLTTRGIRGHQIGAPLNPRSTGRLVKTQCCVDLTHFQEVVGAAATGTPMSAPSSNRLT